MLQKNHGSRIVARSLPIFRTYFAYLFFALALLQARPSGDSLALGSIIALLGIGVRLLAAGVEPSADGQRRVGIYQFMSLPIELGSVLVYVGVCFAARDLLMWLLLMIVVTCVAKVRPLRDAVVNANDDGLLYSANRASTDGIVFFPHFWSGNQRFGTDLAGLSRGSFSMRRSLERLRAVELSKIIAIIALFGWFLLQLRWSVVQRVSPWAALVVCAAIMLRAMYDIGLFKRPVALSRRGS